MTMVNRRIPAGEFKAKVLALLDEVAKTGETLVITKRGRPVAQLSPLEPVDPFAGLRGSILRESDLLSPLSATWEAES
ncbi:MAG: type II toxin-antitoxin system prevent-host-death family antitoxin [Cyanobacteria bacterium REEB65]|nr:type II toxin-antitoxin system prevent-host-death family antitoxin [Cyanobacteria bacterium REEB65]